MNILADSDNQIEHRRMKTMGAAEPITKTENKVTNLYPAVSVADVCEDIETIKGVISFLADVGCTGLFSGENGIRISEEGDIGLTYILRNVADELDKISSCCAANLAPKA
ncbi:MAG: hypothetical protein PHI97_25615 [Desulfobulbus sp.]|nr:hypothetical protein [Desulfobulbus sp.]